MVRKKGEGEDEWDIKKIINSKKGEMLLAFLLTVKEVKCVGLI